MVKNKSSFIIVFWWLLVLALCGFFLFCFAPKEERVSESENRMLSGFPPLSGQTLASGEFFLGIESYLSDGVWGRDSIVGVSESLLDLFSANTAEEESLLGDIAINDGLQAETGVEAEDTAAPAASGSDAPAAPQDPVQPDGGEDDTAGQTGEVVQTSEELSGYGIWHIRENGTYVQLTNTGDKTMKKVADTLNAFKDCLPEDGAVFYTNVPLTNRALSARDYYAGWYENIAEGLLQYTNEGVYPINTPALLAEPLWRGDNIYFTSDHHWSPMGAVIVVNECVSRLGIPTVPYGEYEYTVRLFTNAKEGTSDDLPLLHPLQEVTGYRMTRGRQGSQCELISYESNNYMAYLYGDSAIWTKYITGFATGRRALVIGDSFSNTFVPYLMPYYDEVHKVDARYYVALDNGGSMSELIEKYGIDDVYIIVSYATGVTSEISKTGLMKALYD